MVLRLVDEKTFFMSAEEVMKTHIYGKVGIHYAFNNYHDDVQHVLALRDEVLKDHPSMSDKDMKVWILSREETISHAGFTTLHINVPIEEYLKLRKENVIDIR